MSDSPTPPHRTKEALLAKAQRRLAKIDQDRSIAQLIQEGWDDDQITAHLDAPPNRAAWARRELAEGREVRPLTPRELGWRRMAGQISTEDMMDQLRTWPYTFGTLHYDWWDRGTWDDVALLLATGFLSREEYRDVCSVIDDPNDHITHG